MTSRSGWACRAAMNGRWVLTTFGIAKAEPPQTFSEMIGLAEKLLPTHIAAALNQAEPFGEVCAPPLPGQPVAVLRQAAVPAGSQWPRLPTRYGRQNGRGAAAVAAPSASPAAV